MGNREAKKAEVLVSVIDRYLVLLTDTVTVLSEAAASQMFLPPTRVIWGATSVYKCDKGLFARGFCVLKCVQRCVRKRVQFVKSVSARGAWRSHNPKPLQVAGCWLLVAGFRPNWRGERKG